MNSAQGEFSLHFQDSNNATTRCLRAQVETCLSQQQGIAPKNKEGAMSKLIKSPLVKTGNWNKVS